MARKACIVAHHGSLKLWASFEILLPVNALDEAQRTPGPRNVVRLGVSAAGTSILLLQRERE